jgi:hypothetical protein
VFAPTDQAFEQLPEGALDELMKQENQAQLTKLLEHHVVEGEAIAAADVLGQQTQVDTMSGDTLTVDGTSQVVLLVPTGLTIAQVGDQLVIEREGVALATRAIAVEGQQPQGQEEQTAARTPTAEESDMPMTEHQQEVLETEPERELQQTAPEGTAMPSTEHQREALDAAEQMSAQEEETAARTPVEEETRMPMTEHQQEVLETEPEPEQQQTAPEGATAMPETQHQQQVLAEEEQPGEQQQSADQARVEGKPDILREATVVGADIQADNGVIHVIDAVLVPQEVLKTLESFEEGQG